jgi:hypothetical protein
MVLMAGQTASGQFTSGNLVVVQTSGSVSKAGSPVTLKEYSPSGAPGTTVAIPATGSTPMQMAAGSGGSEGFITRSADGTALMLAGYATSTSYPVDITVTTSAAAPRAIFKVDAFGNYSMVGSSTTNYSANDIRGAITDGTNYWASGASNINVDGIDYYGPGTPAALGVSAKAYGLQIFNNQIYFSTQKTLAGVTPNFGIYSLGIGLPTSGTITPTLVINTGAATPEDFSFSPAGDICYIAINLNTPVGGIQKWTNNGSGWTLAYTLGTGATNIGAYGLVVDYSGANPIVYATSNESNTVGNRIIKIVDTGAGSSATTLVTGAANTWFHGITFSPTCPLPSQPGAFTASSSSVNLGQSGVAYTVPNDPTVTYTWNYSGTGATIVGSGNSITVNFSSTATNGTLSVKANNSCGISAATSLAVSINGSMRITEYMYSGTNGEFIEFTNVGGTSVDMTGWSSDDATRSPGGHNLSAFGVVQPGESVILTETASATFRSAWGLCPGIKIIGGYTNDNLGRSDEINLYNGTTLIDRLTFNDQGTGTVKGPRTQNASAWITAAGLGNNNASLSVLSVVGDSEGSFSSPTGGDIGSPGKSSRATVSYNPCLVINGAPTIVFDVATTSNFLDGGITTPPASPYGVSGVISDPTDPASTLGMYFTVNDAETPVNSLIVTATSSNTTVVPASNVVLTGNGASWNVKITPTGVGYSNITVSVNDGTTTTSFLVSYAASEASATPNATIWSTGMSDASDGIPIDDNYYITGDDELNVLNVYSRSISGKPFVSFDYSAYLNLPEPAKPEADLEAAARSTTNVNKMYWLGSMSNGKAPFDSKPNRNRIFATTITGTGASTAFTFAGYYGNLRATLIAWGDANGYNFTASAAAGVDSKIPSGFAAEGMVFGPDNTTLYIGMRAPLVPTATRTNAVIAPILNFETWFNNGAPATDPVFGPPIELDLGLRGIRDLIRLSNGTYVILAGNPGSDPLTSALFKWTGNANDLPILIQSSADGVLNIEGALEVKVGGNLSLSQLQVISDGGDENLYNDGSEAKDFGDLSLRKFRMDNLSSLDLSLCQNVSAAVTPNGPTTFCNGDSVVLTASAGKSYLWSNGATTPSITVKTSQKDSVTVTNVNGCVAKSAAVQVIANSLPSATISASGSTTFCVGDSVVLTATAGMSAYHWSNGAATVSVTLKSSEKDSVKVTDTNGCSSISSATQVSVNALPVVTVSGGSPVNLLEGDSLTLQATVVNRFTYQWEKNASQILGAVSSTLVVKSNGDYEVTVIDSNTCSSASNHILVNILHKPTLSTISKSVAENSSLSFTTGDFTSAFTDIDGNALTKVKFTALPQHGVLKLGSAIVALNQEILSANLGQLTYVPTTNYSGAETMGWNGADNTSYAATGANILLTVTPVNVAPTTSVTSPAANTEFNVGSNVTITANAADVDGTIKKVLFYAGPTKLGEDATAPYSFVWTNVAAGGYNVYTKAIDDQNATTTSATVYVHVNMYPTVSLTAPSQGATLAAGNITVSASASDPDGSVKKVQFFANGIKIAEDSVSPFSITWQVSTSGNYSLTANAIDNKNAVTTSSAVTVTVNGVPQNCTGSGSITREVYYNIPGWTIPDLTGNSKFPSSPDAVGQVTTFEAPANIGLNYGSRIYGFICAPLTGDYTFWIAADDRAELWLSTDESPANRQLIASVPTAVNPRAYIKYPQQKAIVSLVKGRRYFIEALHKQYNLNDHISVAWTLPSNAFENPIPGSRLSPWTGGTIARTGNMEVSGSANDAYSHMTVSPIPAQDLIHVNFYSDATSPAEVYVTDILSNEMTRKEVDATKGMNNVQLSINGLPNGLYLVHTVVGNKRDIVKIVVAK